MFRLTAKSLTTLVVVALVTGCATTSGPPSLKRTPVNPWSWGDQFGMNQGEIIEGGSRTLILSGQTSLDAELNVQHPDDFRQQWEAAFRNLETALAAAGMSLANVVHLTIYTTDMDATLENWDLFVSKVRAAGVQPPQSLIGVARLALPGLQIEMEAMAMD